jgi:hypothetical protein
MAVLAPRQYQHSQRRTPTSNDLKPRKHQVDPQMKKDLSKAPSSCFPRDDPIFMFGSRPTMEIEKSKTAIKLRKEQDEKPRIISKKCVRYSMSYYISRCVLPLSNLVDSRGITYSSAHRHTLTNELPPPPHPFSFIPSTGANRRHGATSHPLNARPLTLFDNLGGRIHLSDETSHLLR